MKSILGERLLCGLLEASGLARLRGIPGDEAGGTPGTIMGNRLIQKEPQTANSAKGRRVKRLGEGTPFWARVKRRSVAQDKGNTGKRIRVVLADDHRVVREGLHALLDCEDTIEVVGEASDGREAVQMAKALSPDVVVMDIAMPGMSGTEATREIHASKPATRIIGLSMYSDSFFVCRMLDSGAKGCLLKSCAVEELVRAIRAVMNDRIYLGEGITASPEGKAIPSWSQRVSGARERLTNLEREVLRLVAGGKTTKEIASDLNISFKTADTHRQHIMQKLGLRTVAELTKFALLEGLSPLED